jgi:hypothetical protein
MFSSRVRHCFVLPKLYVYLAHIFMFDRFSIAPVPSKAQYDSGMEPRCMEANIASQATARQELGGYDCCSRSLRELPQSSLTENAHLGRLLSDVQFYRYILSGFERHHALSMYLNYDVVREGSLLMHNFCFIVLERLTKISRH